MRRILPAALLILLLSPACGAPGLRYPDWDAPAGIGAVRGRRGIPPPPQPVPCREMSRIPCDVLHCKGPGFDLVTMQCGGKATASHCMPNGRCKAETAGDD